MHKQLTLPHWHRSVYKSFDDERCGFLKEETIDNSNNTSYIGDNNLEKARTAKVFQLSK